MKTKNYDDHLKERLDHKEIKKLETRVKLERDSLKALQRGIASVLAEHMKETGMGFNDVARGLGVSASQVAKIQKAEANLTFASVAHIAAFLGKKPHLSFK
ncbi:MAG TPA: helix-turn-helix transcriptional regulator [Myxococcota bacterium]|nr:helix-turn-helix transcriptional regulator [Myxococcota bacterium]